LGFGVLAFGVVCLGLRVISSCLPSSPTFLTSGSAAGRPGSHASRGSRHSSGGGAATCWWGCSIKRLCSSGEHCQDMLEYSGVILQQSVQRQQEMCLQCTESLQNVGGAWQPSSLAMGREEWEEQGALVTGLLINRSGQDVD